MTVTLEEFAASLIKNIFDRTKGGGGYVLGSVLMSSIQMALIPPGAEGQEYPRWMYRRAQSGDGDEGKVVPNCEEEMAAAAEGWSRTPSPQPPGFPQNWVEVDRAQGSDYCRVLIRNPKEEQLFREVVDLANWTQDDKYALAGLGIALSRLVEEHKEILKAMIDQDKLEIIPDNVGPESATTEESPQQES